MHAPPIEWFSVAVAGFLIGRQTLIDARSAWCNRSIQDGAEALAGCLISYGLWRAWSAMHTTHHLFGGYVYV
jgi:myo-inositol catabolism protein IolC